MRRCFGFSVMGVLPSPKKAWGCFSLYRIWLLRLEEGYNCKYFVREIPNDTEITEHLNSDPSIFHAVMVGFLFSEALRVVALRHPGVRFSLIDASIDNTYPLNCQGITFAEDEAGFLAGVVAGALTDTGIVGVMGNLPIPPVQRYVYGFLNGVKYINPSVTTYSRFNLDFSWANSTLGALNAKEFLSRGVDVFSQPLAAWALKQYITWHLLVNG
ncbi:basic membrane protein-domain-containing protein [Chytridium lagenaria]|nr:basic membrane protein-domain-containing protein [Chytridium lagenaria]